MKNYYEILEVSEKASQEVIEKAYKALAKKYHPDVQEPDKKKWAEEKFKEISEAFEILSNEENKKKYDIELANSKTEEKNTNYNNANAHDNNTYNNENTYDNNTNNNYNSENDYDDILAKNAQLKQEINYLKNERNQDIINQQRTQEALDNAINKAYNDAYIQRLKDYGYKIRYKKSFKTKFKNFVTLLLTIIVLFIIAVILWQIPSIKNYILDVYNNNLFLQFIGKIIFKSSN